MALRIAEGTGLECQRIDGKSRRTSSCNDGSAGDKRIVVVRIELPITGDHVVLHDLNHAGEILAGGLLIKASLPGLVGAVAGAIARTDGVGMHNPVIVPHGAVRIDDRWAAGRVVDDRCKFVQELPHLIRIV